MSRARRSTWNYLSVLCFTAITLVIGLVATRLLVSWLGQERLGAYRALSDWGGYLTLFDLGISGALLPMIARALNRGDKLNLAGGMSSGFQSYRRILGLYLVGEVALYILIPRLVPTSAQMAGDLRRAVIIMSVGSLLLPLSPLRPLWEADQRGYAVTAILIVQSLFITGASLLFAWLQWGVSGQALAALIGVCVYSVALAAQTIRRHPEVIRWFIAKPPSECRAELRSLNWPMFAVGVSGRLSLLTDNIVIAYFLGSAIVVPFFITQRLVQVVQSQLQSVGNSTWAGMLHLRETEGSAAFNDRLVEFSQLIMVLGLSAIVPIISYNANFVGLWMPSKGLYGGLILTTLASVNGVLQGMFSFWGWMFSGAGKIREILPFLLTSTAVNVIASVGSTAWLKATHPPLAIIGPVLGTSIAFISCNCWWLPLLLRQYFDVSLTALLRASSKPLLIFLPMLAATFLSARAYPPKNWVTLIAEMAIAAVINLLGSWLIVLNRSQKRVWTERLVKFTSLIRRRSEKVGVVS